MFSMALYTDADADCKYVYFCPPLILKNMFLKNIKLQLYRVSMGREYSDDYELNFDSDTVEVYNTGSMELDKLRFRVEINSFLSETISVDLSQARRQELTGNFWMYFEGTKKFTLNYNIYFAKGSFVLTVYAQHLVFNDLFRRVVFSQRGDRFEDNLVSIELLDKNTTLNKFKSSIWTSPASNTSMLMTGGDKELHKSDVYILPFSQGDIWLSD